MKKDLCLPLCTCSGEIQPRLSSWYGMPRKNRKKYSLLQINLVYGGSLSLGWEERHRRAFDSALELINRNNSPCESHAQSSPQITWGVPTSSRHNFYPLEFSCLSHFRASFDSAGCSHFPRQPWPWQGAAPTPVLPAPACSENLPRDSNAWLVRDMHVWVPGG